MDGQATKRDLKRKRYEPPEQDISVKIGGKLHHHLKEVKHAAKKAKAFETQKLIKKLKDLRKKEENAADIAEAERQLEALKALDHELVATTALKTKLNKVRLLHENEHVQAAISNELSAAVVPATAGTAEAKVQGRLLSSKVLATEIAGVVGDLRSVLQPKVELIDADDESVLERPKKLKKVDGAKEVGAIKEKKSKTPANAAASSTEEDDGDEEGDGGGDDADEAGWESGTVDGDEQGAMNGWSSGSVDDEDDEESDDDDEGLAITPVVKKKPPPPKVPLAKPSAKSSALQSTFLPSLSVGFTRGESDDSDLSESEVKVADIDIKKNRRGQRARRAIWEKKYGSGANHKKKEATEGKEFMDRRKSGNTPQSSNRPFNKHGAPTQRQAEPKSVPQHRQEADSGWGQRTAGARPPAQTIAPPTRSFMKGRVEEKPLHPSWEAKKKLKEKQSAGIVPSQGKKITFS